MDETRLLGHVEGKRVLELGCGDGETSVDLAKHGARVIAVDESSERLANARRLADREEVKVELHHGDLADLAFVRADTIDVALSAGALNTVADLDRVFRQVHRVLKPESGFVLSLRHPASRVLDSTTNPPTPARTYFDRQPVTTDDQRVEYPRTIADVFTSLARANFRIDTVVESEADRAWVPDTLILRARKEGI